MLKYTPKITSRFATTIPASPTRSITISTFLPPTLLPDLTTTSQRTLSTTDTWRVAFQQVQTSTQLALTLDRLFYKHPQPHSQTILYALATFIRLASHPQNTAHPLHHHYDKISAPAPKNQLEALLTNLRLEPLHSSTDLAHLAQTKLLSRVPFSALTLSVHKSYLDLLCLTSTTPSVPFAYLSELPKNTQTIDMSRSVLTTCARHNDIQLAHKIIALAYKRASEMYNFVFWLGLGIRLTIAAQAGKIAALAAVATWGSQNTESAGVVGLGFGMVVGTRLIGLWALKEMGRKDEGTYGLLGLQKGVGSTRPDVVRSELYEYFLSLVRNQEMVERVKMEMKEKGVT